MTLNVTVPDAVYRQMAELAARQPRPFPGRAGQGSRSRTRPEDRL
jgi:hypothetical protein